MKGPNTPGKARQLFPVARQRPRRERAARLGGSAALGPAGGVLSVNANNTRSGGTGVFFMFYPGLAADWPPQAALVSSGGAPCV